MKLSRGWIAVFLVLAVALARVWTVYAWDCSKYNFQVTSGGEVQVENKSGSDEPAQHADIFVNGEKVLINISVPAMESKTSWTSFASVRPRSGDWTWKVEGSKDCEDSGKHEGERPTATPDPTVTDKPRPTHTQDPTPTVTPDPTRSPSETPTATNAPPTDPPPTDKPQPSDTSQPKPSDTPRPKSVPSNTPTRTATAISMLTATPTVTSTATIGCAFYCQNYDGEVWAYIHIDDEAKAQLAQAISWGNEPLVAAVEQSDIDILIEAELQPILYVLVGIFAVLGGNLILGIYTSVIKK